MSGSRHYLDYNASAPLHPRARHAMLAAFDVGGNPSSVHREGREARAIIETARAEIAALVGSRAADVVFVSGGTEAANLALSPRFLSTGGRDFDVLLIGAGEHPCVLTGHRFPAECVQHVALGADGQLNLAHLEDLLGGLNGARALLALQIANNETGVVQPVQAAAALMRAAGGTTLCDGVQGLGKMALDIEALGVEAMFLSAHKIGGPKGVGALVMKRNFVPQIDPLLRGGGQERGLRAGTENVAGIAGFGAAAKVAGETLTGEALRLAGLRDRFESELATIAPQAVIFGQSATRLPNTSAFAVPGLPAQTALMGLDLAGVAVSSGSACSSGKVRRSHVLEAMGVAPDLAEGALRVSFGWGSDYEDVQALIGAAAPLVAKASAKRAA
ncbi:MAG: cysteine desulfurase [Hyphomicrobiales bacterium]|nr:cysteine desulfurase [Hyphomicrobiales bacterium]MDE2115087.1 cysteine desulfurase [Hyphomicrobiales bacterium]